MAVLRGAVLEPLVRGPYRAYCASSPQDIDAAQALRARAFGLDETHDSDGFDAKKHHILVRDQGSGELLCCYRIGVMEGASLDQSYAAQFYDLTKLAGFDGPMMELGRFCLAPEVRDPDVVRMAWAALAQVVDAHAVTLLFGCTSFRGTDPAPYRDVMSLLQDRHLAPQVWRPQVKAPETVGFAKGQLDKPAEKAALQMLPALLRSYLMMGGWVSDHAVIDRQMKTLHVFTGLEIAAIPEGRKRLLRGTA
eukprot:GHVR01054252.1.p1 GENE.GHVR01054252.1~~GHVR01054252.1.p1  ORF type:complete len:250 (-),score=59.28 GHVR01054252.1:534-1283(-)